MADQDGTGSIPKVAGMAGPAQSAAGNDAILHSVNAVRQALDAFASDLAVVSARTDRMGVPDPQGGQISRTDLDAMVREAVRSAGRGRPEPMGEYQEPPQPTHRRRARPADEEQDRESPRGEARYPVANWDEEYAARRDFFKDERGNFSLGGIRRKAGEAVMQRTNRYVTGEGELTQTSPGEFRDPEGRIVKKDSTGRWRTESGQFVSGEGITQGRGTWRDASGRFASAQQVDEFMRREKVVAAPQEFGRALMHGRSLREAGMGALPSSLAKTAGVVGAAVTVAGQVGDFMEQQRAANAEWQAIMGGGQGEAVGQRFQQRMFGLSQFGIMDSEQAQRMFMEVSKTGMAGDERQNALDFAMQNYRQLGMSVDQSMELVRLAAETGTESLQGVAKSLREVSESAVEAGVNAETARKLFIGQYESLLSLTGSGPGASQLAGALTGASVGLGRDLAGYGFNFDNEQYLSRIGMTQLGGASLNNMIGMMDDFEGQQQMLQAAERQLTQDASLIFQGSGYQRAQQMIAQGATPDMIVSTLLDDRTGNGFIPVQQLVPMLSQMGYDVRDIRGTLKFIVSTLSGQYQPAAEHAELMTSMEVETLDEKSIAAARQAASSGRRGDDLSFGAKTTFGEEAARAQGSVNRGFANLGISWLGGADTEGQRVAEAYTEMMASTGMYGGIAGEIAADAGIRGQIDKVKVITPEGERIVDLWTAIQYYGDQVMRGDVQVVSGSDEATGKTLSEVAGGGFSDMDIAVTSSSEGPVKGQTVEDFKAEIERARSRGEDVGSVMINLHPDFRRFFTAQTTGSATIEDDWTTGTQHVSGDSLPTGNP